MFLLQGSPLVRTIKGMLMMSCLTMFMIITLGIGEEVTWWTWLRGFILWGITLMITSLISGMCKRKDQVCYGRGDSKLDLFFVHLFLHLLV